MTGHCASDLPTMTEPANLSCTDRRRRWNIPRAADTMAMFVTNRYGANHRSKSVSPKSDGS